MIANAGTLLTDGGNAAIGSIKSTIDIVTDYASFRQAALGVTMAAIHPVTTYDHVVDAASRWMDRPLDEQMRDVGDVGMSLLALGGTQEGVGLGVRVAAGYVGDLASTLKSVSTLNQGLNWLEAPQGDAAPRLGVFGAKDAEVVVPSNAEIASGINPGATLRDYLGDLDKNTMIHLTSFPQEAFENGIEPGTFFARYGDVAHLTPQQYRIGVVGPAAGGYGPDANFFVTVSSGNSEEFFTPWESAFGYVEWQNPSKVMPDKFFSVPSGPQLPYPETAIPPPPSPHP